MEAVTTKIAGQDMPWLKEYGPGISRELKQLPQANLAQLVRDSAATYADKPAFTICLDNGLNATLTYREVDQLSDAFAAYLEHELGLQKGDRIAVQAPNCLAYPICSFGIFKAGGILVNVNPLYTAPEMNHQLKDSGAKVLVIIDMFADKLSAALQGTQVQHVVLASVVDFFPQPKQALLKTVLKYVKKAVPKCPMAAVTLPRALKLGRAHLGKGLNRINSLTREDTAVLQYTGGTTGVAKGAELTHGNLLTNLAQVQTLTANVTQEGKEVVLTALPLYHIFAFTANMLTFLATGGHNILCPSPRPVSNLRKAFELFPPTKFAGVNVLFQGLLREPWFRENPPRSLSLTFAGGTALHPHVAEEWKKLVGSPIAEGYGLSETSPVVTTNPVSGEVRVGTIGVPMPGTEIRILDDNGQPLGYNEPGELAVKGPQVMKGYWNRPEATAEVMKDGWFRTGDIAVMDERGYIRIVDRKKDMIDVNGFNVYPNEVEAVINAHPDVLECAVIGVKAPTGSETVRAYVAPANDKLTAEELDKWCRERLTPYKVPKEFVFRKELPKSPVGKILRKDLRAEANAGK
jgi:Acyl-CoA synthetases (AMP-forming)/AMP-acid ligases II